MKKTFFTVGPSQIYPTVPSHIQKAVSEDVLSMNHRSQEFKDMYKDVVLGLRKLLNIPDTYQIVFVSSALEAMERILMAMSHNNSYHLITGNFGKIWLNIAKDLGKATEDFTLFDMEKGELNETNLKNLKIPAKSELVCITQNDTSVGFSIPMTEIYELRKKYPNKLFALDIVSSVPYVDIEYKYLDAVFFSVQKGFGLPAGLGVLVLSPKAVRQAQKLSKLKQVSFSNLSDLKNLLKLGKIERYSIGSYHSLAKLAENSEKFQTTETPNVLGIYLLGCVVKDFLKIGISKLRNRLDQQAQMLYSFFSGPENQKGIQDVVGVPFVKSEKYRSVTTPVFEIAKGSEGLRKFAAEKGLILGAGYKPSLPAGAGKDFKNKHIRIGNFPAITERDVKKLVKIINAFKK